MLCCVVQSLIDNDVDHLIVACKYCFEVITRLYSCESKILRYPGTSQITQSSNQLTQHDVSQPEVGSTISKIPRLESQLGTHHEFQEKNYKDSY